MVCAKYRMVLQQLKLINMKNKRLQYNNGGGLNFTAKNVGGLDLHFGGSSSNVGSRSGSSFSVGASKNNTSFKTNFNKVNRGGGYQPTNISGQTKVKDIKIKSSVDIGSGTGSVSATKNNITLSAGRRQSGVPTYGKENFVDVTFNQRF